MAVQPLSGIIQASLLRRLLLPALAVLLLLSAFLLDLQRRGVEERNVQFARTMAVYTDKYLDGAFAALERLAGELEHGRARSLADLTGVLPAFRRLALLDQGRMVLDAWPEGPRGVEYPLRLGELDNGRLLLSRPVSIGRAGDVAVAVAVRLKGGGVLTGELDLSVLTSHMGELGVAMGGEVIVCDGFGNLVCHPDQRLVARQGNIGDSPLYRALKSGVVSLLYAEDGIDYLGSGAPVPELGWMVFVRTPAYRALAPAAVPVAVGASVMALAWAGITLLLRGRLDRHVVRPLAGATARLDALQPGQVYRAGQASGFGELARFENALQDMTGRIARDEELMRRSLAEKEVLLREIHHRVKNNLQIISSLLYLQGERIEDQELQDCFRTCRQRIGCMALVHEALHRSENLDDICMANYAGQLLSRLMGSVGAGRGIQCDLQAEGLDLHIAQAVPLGLILNELVTNTVKHAFPDGKGGKLEVVVRQVDSLVRVEVTDNGVGLPEGFDPEATDTLGMQLVVQLTRQLHGELRLGKGKGASFSITFPLMGAQEAARESHDR